MATLTPYLLFENGNCKEAMTFYQSCLGGDLSLTSVRETPMKATIPTDKHDLIINAKLASTGLTFSASDWLLPNRTPRQGNTVCMYISEASYSDIKGYFDMLSIGADATTLDPLVDMPFGFYGALTDKFGVRWMFKGDRAS